MGWEFVTASKSVIPYNSSSNTRPITLTSIVAGPLAETGICARVTLYRATAATDGTQFMVISCGTAPRTITWSDPSGIDIDKLFITLNCAVATIVWK